MRVIKNIIGSIFIAIAAMVSWVFILPGYEMQSYLKSSVEIRSAAVEIKSGLIQKVADLTKEYEDKFNELKRLSLVVPAEKNVPEIITSIEDISSQAGINLSEFGVFDGADNSGANPYGLVLLEIIFSGTYDSTLNLLNHIERHIRLIDATSLSVSINESESTESNTILDVSLKANMYFLKPQSIEKNIIKNPVTDENQ